MIAGVVIGRLIFETKTGYQEFLYKFKGIFIRALLLVI